MSKLQIMRASIARRTRQLFALTFFSFLLSQIAVDQTSIKAMKPPRPPGKLVDIGGWRLHLNCTGSNKGRGPTVVLESGAGDFSFDWSLVQPGVSSFTRVCSYDRAGNAWSDLGPRPRSMKQIAYELHTALRKSGNPGPYVLVGQSIGGLLIRTFAGLYAKEVAGMCLVDSTHEDTTLFMNGKIQRMRDLSQGRTIPPIQKTIRASDKMLAPEERKKLEEFLKQIGPPKINPPFDLLPLSIQKWRLWAKAQPQHYVADDDPYWGEEFAEFYAARQAKEYPLGDTPLIVLTRGKREYPDTEEGKQLDEDRKRMQRDLLNLSSNSKQIIATTSGHHIQLDDPKLVIDAIRQVVDSVRRPAKM
ncbi:MAG TPA: alpha/beta hydrolase [Pyrinomonadaceae bacterium]|nr:alpha/beta hydrolase [Pyrinomonadaceae bacterium]